MRSGPINPSYPTPNSAPSPDHNGATSFFPSLLPLPRPSTSFNRRLLARSGKESAARLLARAQYPPICTPIRMVRGGSVAPSRHGRPLAFGQRWCAVLRVSAGMATGRVDGSSASSEQKPWIPSRECDRGSFASIWMLLASEELFQALHRSSELSQPPLAQPWGSNRKARPRPNVISSATALVYSFLPTPTTEPPSNISNLVSGSMK